MNIKNCPIMQKEQKKLNRKFMNAVMEKSVIRTFSDEDWDKI